MRRLRSVAFAPAQEALDGVGRVGAQLREHSTHLRSGELGVGLGSGLGLGESTEPTFGAARSASVHLSQPHGSRTAAVPAALVGSACSVMPDVSRRDSAGGESGSASAAPSPPAGVGILTESAILTPTPRNARVAPGERGKPQVTTRSRQLGLKLHEIEFHGHFTYVISPHMCPHMPPPHFIGGAGGIFSRSTTDLTELRSAITSFLASPSASPIFSSLPA